MDKKKNRAEFFKSVEQNVDDYPSVITSLFDQFSLLYNLVGQYQSVNISNGSTYNKVQFMINCKDEDQFNMIFNNIISKGNYTELYGRIFFVNPIKKSPTSFLLQLVSKDVQIVKKE